MKVFELFLGIVFVVAAQAAGSEILVQSLGDGGVPPEPVGELSAESGWYDAGDYYIYRGERIALLRSRREYVVQFMPGIDRAMRQQMLDSASVTGHWVEHGQTWGGQVSVVELAKPLPRQDLEAAIVRLRSFPEVRFVFPVFLHSQTKARMIASDELTVELAPGVTIEEVTARYGLAVVRKLRGAERQYILRTRSPKVESTLDLANALTETEFVEWAEPNFIQEYWKNFIPNDPLFPEQWHLNNAAGVDVNAAEAWDLEQGVSSTVIAVIDDGVDMSHEDLSENIFVNAGEIPGNGIDDDGNGFVDDVNGWDFFDNDNDPSPGVTDDNHGTAVAGVAAARGDNAIGVSGMCPNCKILPVRIFRGDVCCGDAVVAEAIRYASSLADVLNGSWGGSAPSSVIQSALQDGTTTGRNGKGVVAVFASGNLASGYFGHQISGFPAGTHRIRWEYTKDGSVDAGDDTAWLAWVRFPGGELTDFESGLPGGWSSGGARPWSVVDDPTHADEGACLVHAAKAGSIDHGQTSYLEVVKTVPGGELFYFVWISSEPYFDGLHLLVDVGNNGSIDFDSGLIWDLPLVYPDVLYPAAYAETIAVGADSDLGCRSYYSEFGPELDIVAPSSGGFLNRDITTTDRTGFEGYDPSNYVGFFGGTSSSTPLTSGVAALMISQNPGLTQTQVREFIQESALKVGPEPYVEGRNDRYGYGQLDAFGALEMSQRPVSSLGIIPIIDYLMNSEE